MLNRKGNIEVEFDGVKYGFRFTTWAIKEAQKVAGCKGVIELYSKIGFDNSNIDLESFLILLVEAAKEYNYYEKIDSEVTDRGVSEIIDKMGGLINALPILTEGLKQHETKNLEAPEMTGQEILN
jgi:hypothetical protein